MRIRLTESVRLSPEYLMMPDLMMPVTGDQPTLLDQQGSFINWDTSRFHVRQETHRVDPHDVSTRFLDLRKIGPQLCILKFSDRILFHFNNAQLSLADVITISDSSTTLAAPPGINAWWSGTTVTSNTHPCAIFS